MICWHDLLIERPSRPSYSFQTLIYKAIFEHCLDYAQVASIALASKSIQNSSLSPNFASKIIIDDKSVKLFESVFSASSSIPLQFVPQLRCDNHLQLLVDLVKTTKYFTNSLRVLTLQNCKVSDFLLQADPTFAGFTALNTLALIEVTLMDSDVETINNNSSTRFPCLCTISVDNRFRDGEERGRCVASRLRHLKSFAGVGDARCLEDIAANSTKLETLEFHPCDHFGENSLKNFGARLQRTLTKLDFIGASPFTRQGLEQLTPLHNLTSLNLRLASINDDVDWESFLSSFPKLSKLNLSCCTLSEETFAEISKMTNLKTLDLSSTFLSSGADRDSLDIKNCLAPLAPTLTDLDLSDWRSFPTDALSCLTNLSKVNLSFCVDINDDVMGRLPKKCITDLNLAGCRNVKFVDFPIFDSVTILEVRFADITDEKLARMKVAFPNVKQLFIEADESQPKLTDVALEHVSRLQSLESLILTNCLSVTNRGLKLIFTQLRRLISFTFSSRGVGVTDEIFEECISDIRRLSSLEVSFFHAAGTANTLKKVQSSCPHLRFKWAAFSRDAPQYNSVTTRPRCLVQ